MSDVGLAELLTYVEERLRSSDGSPVWVLSCSAPGCTIGAVSQLSAQRAARAAWTFDWEVRDGKPYCWEHATNGGSYAYRGD